MSFVVIDVETANPDFASICQVGLAEFRDGKFFGSWETLVNPEDYFDEMNIAVHGIEEHMVRQAPKWSAVHEQLSLWLRNRIVASHTAFDRTALARACSKNGLQPHECRWLDTARVVRRAWPEFSQKGYGLANVTKHFGIKFQHHDAKEDARAAGEILLHAVEATGLSVEQWLERSEQPISMLDSVSIARAANVDGPLFGEMLVFTGALSMPRREAADAASAAGCEVETGVTKHTTVLVVGDQDIYRLAGHEKSSKHRKAEDLMKKGQQIRIIGESDFQRLLGLRA
ncbi:MAG: transposase [Gammaproteobacteria bacterium]|nr:transposase [Gammaproteobacteria bacterium]